jgi:sugar phosphate permease
LSPSGGAVAVLIPLAVVFYAARLLLLFVVPGLVVGALALWAFKMGRDDPAH